MFITVITLQNERKKKFCRSSNDTVDGKKILIVDQMKRSRCCVIVLNVIHIALCVYRQMEALKIVEMESAKNPAASGP
jgi:hypothetical protein